MALLINHGGKQLGPYSLDEARALVLSGEVDADDWAWPDGATEWIVLKEVPGFAPEVPTAGKGAPPPPAAHAAEEEIWRGHPSQILNFKVYFIWVAVLLAAGGVSFLNPLAILLPAVLSVVALVHIGWCFFQLRSIEYVVTNQRVRVISGLLSKKIEEIELFRVKDTEIHQPFFLRILGLGEIVIVSGDATQPRLVMSGVPGAVELRERLRQDVMTLRQRFGVRELDMM